MSIRIAHISDTHLGTRPRDGIKQNAWGVEMRTQLLENDYYERFKELFETIAALDPPVDIVVHSGDLYNSPWEGNPLQPPVVAQEIAISVLKNFIETTGIPVLILEGNHGLYRSLEVSLLDTLRIAVPGLLVATQQELKRAFSAGQPLVRNLEKLDVYCFPFLEKNVLDSSNLTEKYNDWILTYQKPIAKRASIAVAHGMELDETLYPAIFSLPYDYIALGHDHHQHRHAKNAWYAGSPERWRFDEIRHQKGFLVVDISESQDVEVTEIHLDFVRPVFNERLTIESDDTIESVMEKLHTLLEDSGVKTPWNPETAARIRIVIDGSSTKVNGVDLSIALESFRLKALGNDSDYNLVQMKWTLKTPVVEHDPAAYPEIESEFLIEDPESDFLEYLDTIKIEESFDSSLLTKIAVTALKKSVSQEDDKMTLESITEEGSD
ncbi:MAG: exonuclease SbcCD subunit D [Candidatus Thorarchaeota archaeon]